MKAALRKVRPQLLTGLALTVCFSAIVFLLERQELVSERQAAADEQVQNIEQRIAIAAAELDAASAFVAQADPPILLFDDFLGRLSLSSTRNAPWALSRVIDRSDADHFEQQLRMELGNPKYAIDRSVGLPVLAPVVMTYGQMNRLRPGQDAASILELKAELQKGQTAHDLKGGTLIVGSDTAAPAAQSFYITRFLVHDEKAPGRMTAPNLLIRGITLAALRSAGSLLPQQKLQIVTDNGAGAKSIASDIPSDASSHWSAVQPAEIAGEHVEIRLAGYPDRQWPRFWILAFAAGSLATMLYGTFRSGQIIRAEATSLDRALSTTERELADTQRREIAFFENTSTANCETDFKTGKLIRVNDALCRMLGYMRDELIGRSFFDITHPDDRGLSSTSLTDEDGRPKPAVQFEKRYCRKDGKILWGLVNATLHVSVTGVPMFYLTVIVDISARKRDEEVKAMLLRELAHRVRNTVQLTASLSRQSARRARSVADYEAKFHERLTALSAAQDLLFDSGWKSAPIQGIAERTIKPFLPDDTKPDRMVIDLPPVDFQTQQAQTLAIAIHELASNSAQYGALASGGSLSFTGKVLPASEDGKVRLYLKWDEKTPRRLRRPRKTGFGMTMLESAMPEQFQGEAKLTWKSNGLIYEAWLTLTPAA